MIIDGKVNSGVPLPTRIISAIPLIAGTMMVTSSLTFFHVLGSCLIFLSLTILTASGGITVDFQNKLMRNYIKILGFKYGKWQPLPYFDRITMTEKSSSFRAYNIFYLRNPIPDKHTAVTYVSESINLNLRCKRRRLTIRIGKYQELQKLGCQISIFSGKTFMILRVGKKN